MISEYDKGFSAGLIWCAKALRLAALQVENPQWAEFKKDSSSSAVTIRAISKSGQPHFAESLRAIATELEQVMGKPDASPRPTSVE